MSLVEIEIRGSGGAVAPPPALCQCAVCLEALQKGPPFSRCGPSYFIHGPNILIDTPEEIRIQLTRSKIPTIHGCFCSHWHPDHVTGRRVFETNFDYAGGFKNNACTPIYLPSGVARDFRTMPFLREPFEYMEKQGIVELVELAEGETVHFEGCHITPVQLALPNMYAFLIETSEGSRTILAPDELYQWQPPDHLHSADVAILQIGLFEFDPFTGDRRLPEGFLERLGEMNFDMTIDLVKQLRAKRVIISHLEEPEGMSYPRYQELEQLLAPLGLNVSFAYDMQRIPL